MHYVSQEVHLTDATRGLTPAQVVVAGDIERRLLMAECAELEHHADAGNLDAVSVAALRGRGFVYGMHCMHLFTFLKSPAASAVLLTRVFLYFLP